MERAQAMPAFYDDFSDGKVTGRTGTDPWGRPLPEWKGDTGFFDASAGYLICNDGYYHSIYLDSNITCGTWEFKMCFPQGCESAPQSYVYLNPLLGTEGIGFTHKNDNHVYFTDTTQRGDFDIIHLLHGGTPGGTFTYGIADSETLPPGECSCVDDQWHIVKIIIKPNGVVYIFQDDLSVWNGPLKTNEINTEKIVFQTLYSDNHTPYIDDIKVYDGEYLFPDKEVIYNLPENRIILHSGADNPHRLSEIAQSIGDDSIFEYDDTNKTAISHAHIQLRSGAALLIDNETLKFDTSVSNLELRLFRSAEIYIYNSTITTTHSNYFQFTANHDFLVKIDSSVLNNVSAYWHNPNDLFDNFVKNSIINISGGYFRLAGGIPKNILIEKNTFSSIGSSQVVMVERGGETPNVVAGDGNKAYKTEIIIKDNVFNNLEVRSQYARTTQLINCNLSGTSYLYPRSTGDSGNHFVIKYYLDVKVVDENDNPVPGAIVTVINTVDNGTYPAQNVSIVITDDYPDEQNENWGSYSTTTTGTDGHTSLPNNPLSSFVITDLKESWDIGTTEYIYAITAEKNGYTGVVTRINPDGNWYREDLDNYPGVDKGTIVIKLQSSISDYNSGEEIVISPNPYIKFKSTGKDITFGNLPKEATIKIYTVSGKLVKKIVHKSIEDGNSTQWNISNVASGIYIYYIKTSQGEKKGRISIIK
ncbi:MAG: T9SS type A sorting domain-containing protein [Bacteroidetes bacterium]|nr:T9SS type A sorting domain-containing protein [Bacteroidota bacterium]